MRPVPGIAGVPATTARDGSGDVSSGSVTKQWTWGTSTNVHRRLTGSHPTRGLREPHAHVRHLLRTWHTGPRLYDTPWPARFFHDRRLVHGREEDLDGAARIIERGFELDGSRHLSWPSARASMPLVSPVAPRTCVPN
ncbi:hypothetical protein AB0D34_02335 [Streptomyces sp. NPDC048420]|uniref:hypothetical protein n=1 Tax=Streptomyces sp. NPDC048420 TaxID=3155755 RepID=UPI003419B89D